MCVKLKMDEGDPITFVTMLLFQIYTILGFIGNFIANNICALVSH